MFIAGLSGLPMYMKSKMSVLSNVIEATRRIKSAEGSV